MSLKTGTTNGAVRIFGQNLPTTITAGEVSLGSGITVSKIVSAAADELTIEASVSASAPPGPRDISVAGAIKPAALIVYDKVDGIKVLPDAGLARLGGAVFPKQLQQFEAIAYNNGPDGKPNTKDDWNLGPVDAKWSMEEYAAVFGDDDLEWVGAVDKNGLFTPNLDGPNPQRSGNRNNVGDVYLVADYTPPGGAKAMRARSFLLVTVPVYMNWYTAEVGR
jgi:quinohemoprotein amine dehydrogenase